jgi:Skp family chaperone for outer membrane proteins
MQKTSVIILAALIVLAGFWGYRTTQAQPAAPVPAKLAVVNVAQVLTECQENLDREKTTREKEREIKAELARMESEANTIRQELENVLKPGSEEYQDQMLKWYNQRALMESYEQGQKQVFAAKTQAWMETLYQNFLSEVEKIARAEGITLVLNKDDLPPKDLKLTDLSAIIRNRKVLYHSPSLDISAKVMENMDRAYNQKKAEQEKPPMPLP